MKQKHLYSLLDQTFTTVRVKFERKSQQEIEQSLRHKHGASPIQRPMPFVFMSGYCSCPGPESTPGPEFYVARKNFARLLRST